MTLHERWRKIEMLVMDVDGVLTDGSIVYMDQGAELKAFHVRDGTGIKLWMGIGKKAAFLTGRQSAVVDRRAAELGLTAVMQGAKDKGTALGRLLDDQKLRADQAAYIGDDVPDLPALENCGLAVAVADACTEAIERAHYVTRKRGGRGAVRETIELLLRAQGRWHEALARYLNR